MLSAEVEQLKKEFISNQEYIYKKINKGKITEAVDIISLLLEKINIQGPRMQVRDNILHVELCGYYEFYQIFVNRYVCEKLSNILQNVKFYPHFQLNHANKVFIANKELSTSDVYVYIEEESILNKNIYIHIKDKLTDKEKEIAKYELSNLIFNEVEEARSVTNRIYTEDKLEKMKPISKVRELREEKKLEDIESKFFLLEIVLNESKFKKGVHEIATIHPNLILENHNMEQLKENLPLVEFVSVECEVNKKDYVMEYIKENVGEEAVYLTGALGNKYYIDYMVFNIELFKNKVGKIKESTKINLFE